jgi:hypothetical protein
MGPKSSQVPTTVPVHTQNNLVCILRASLFKFHFNNILTFTARLRDVFYIPYTSGIQTGVCVPLRVREDILGGT